ncbi:MAG: hypothetical protein Fur002_11080 [Anaerolineales bacterium]
MRLKTFLFFTLALALLAACGAPATPQAAAPTAVPTHTAAPSATVIPTLSTPLAILVIPADMEKELSDLYQKTVYELAQGSGFRFQVRNTLTAADLSDPTLKIVIALPPDPGIQTYAATAPNVQFLAVELPNVSAGGNISALASSDQVELPAFLAGYVLSMLVDEYHIGMVIPKDDPNAQRAFYAFDNGKKYYCGLCRTFYFSEIGYPTYVEIPADEKPARYGGYANVLINDRKVDALYIYPTLADHDFLAYVGTQGVIMVGTTAPEPRPGGWAMSIRPDIVKAIQTAWASLAAGQGGLSVQSPLGITDVDASILTPGKLRLAQKLLDDLLAGRIATSNP